MHLTGLKMACINISRETQITKQIQNV